MPHNKAKTYPSHVLEDELRKRGIQVRCLWEMRGPPDTFIDWIVGYLVDNSVCIVQTHKTHFSDERQGWNAFTPCDKNEIAATVDDVIARCCRKIPSDRASKLVNF